ncbi:MAG TPA: hypothetical protein VF651_01310 [Gammaproteobacteria bacterium]
MHLGNRLTAFCLMAVFALATSHAAEQAPPASTAEVPQTLDLGSVHVSGKIQVAQVLATIKQALKAPDSTDAKHRDDLVCRFVKELANPRTYLDCATNATNGQRRTNTQTSRLAAACSSQTCDKPQDFNVIIHTLVANQPGDRLHVQVNPHDFRKMLESVTVAPPASTVPAAAPAAATRGL